MLDIRQYIEPSHHGDTTPALDHAVSVAMPKAESVMIPAGWYLFNTRPKPIGGGVTICGESGLTTAHTGTCLVVRYNETDSENGFLTWDGSDPGPNGKGYRGTGGGVRDLTIYKYGNFHGGCALVVKCTNNDQFRAGMWTVENVAVISENGGLWDRILLADGSNIPHVDPKGMGVRTITLQNLFASGAAICNVEFRNAVHVAWNIGQVQQGPAPTTSQAMVKVTGVDTQDIHFTDVSVYGLLYFDQCEQFTFKGLCSRILIDGGNKVKRGIIQAVGVQRYTNNATPEDHVILTAV